MLDIEFIFGNDTAIGSTGHGRKHGGKTRVTAKDVDKHETLCTAGAIDGFFVKKKEVVGVVVVLLPDNIHEASPAVTNANNLITFANGAKSDAANCGIQTGNVATSGEDADDASLRIDVGHNSRI